MNVITALPMPRDETLELVITGKLHTRVEVAETFRAAYRVLDRLCDGRYSRLRLAYDTDFEVAGELMEEFEHAAREALSYKEAIVFGRPIDTIIVGLGDIAHPATRTMAVRLHHRN
jgi:hypothetical protein